MSEYSIDADTQMRRRQTFAATVDVLQARDIRVHLAFEKIAGDLPTFIRFVRQVESVAAQKPLAMMTPEEIQNDPYFTKPEKGWDRLDFCARLMRDGHEP